MLVKNGHYHVVYITHKKSVCDKVLNALESDSWNIFFSFFSVSWGSFRAAFVID